MAFWSFQFSLLAHHDGCDDVTWFSLLPSPFEIYEMVFL